MNGVNARNLRLRIPQMAVFFAFTLFLCGCLDPPVREQLTLRFTRKGDFVVTIKYDIQKNHSAQGNNQLIERLDSTRRSLLENYDPWSRCFRAVRPARERLTMEKDLGELVLHERTILLETPDQLKVFFDYTDLKVFYEEGDEYAEFSVYGTTSTRATADQRYRVSQILKPWSEDIVQYLNAVAALYDYLETSPERAQPCFGHLLEDILDPSVSEALDPLEGREEDLVSAADEAMAAVVGILTVPSDGAFSFNELSHLVYNPFPAKFFVDVDESVLEAEGFVQNDDGRFTVPGLGLWESLELMEGAWVAPDPVITFVTCSLQKEQGGLDLETYSRRPRIVKELPDASDVRAELEKRLVPAEMYRVCWEVSRDRR